VEVCYILYFFQSTFFTCRCFVPVNVVYLRPFVSVSVFPLEVLSHIAFFLSMFFRSTFYTISGFYFDVLSMNRCLISLSGGYSLCPVVSKYLLLVFAGLVFCSDYVHFFLQAMCPGVSNTVLFSCLHCYV
jgi:hypothetical protein